MSASNNTSVAERQDDDLAAKPNIDGGALVRAKRSSPSRFNKLLARYRNLGIADREIVQAMIEAPDIVDAIGGGVRR